MTNSMKHRYEISIDTNRVYVKDICFYYDEKQEYGKNR